MASHASMARHARYPPYTCCVTAQRTLADRRRDATALEIAVAAAALFAEKGVADTTAEAIAERSGVALRTFYRYAGTKVEAVAPLFAVGAAQWQSALADAATDATWAQAVESAIGRVLTIAEPGDAAKAEWTRYLVRAAENDPELAAIWHRVNAESERRVLAVLATNMPDGTDDLLLRLIAAAATAAIRVGVESWAHTDDDFAGPTGPSARARRAFRLLAPRGGDDST